jgi:hypothetical protein
VELVMRPELGHSIDPEGLRDGMRVLREAFAAP